VDVREHSAGCGRLTAIFCPSHSLRMRHTSALRLVCLVLFSACSRGSDGGTAPPTADASILVAGSGFRQVFAANEETRGVGGAQGFIEVPDFTLEGTRLHLMYRGVLRLQQGAIGEFRRRTVDVSSGAVLPQPAGADTVLADYALPNSNWEYGPARYLPYRNYFTFSRINPFGFTPSLYFGGDLKFSYAYPAAVTPDLGFRYPVSNIVNQPHTDNGTGSFGFATLAPSYQFSAYSNTLVEFQNLSRNHTPLMLVESFRNSLSDSVYVIAFRQDSIVAYTISTGSNGRRNLPRQIAGIRNHDNVPVFNGRNSLRHYDVTGNQLSVAVFSQTGVYTFTYNFQTNALRLGLNNVDVGTPSALAGLADLDEAGNFYYATSGVGGGAATVYSQPVTGARAQIGPNSLLRYGQLVRLKYLNGKIFLAAYGVPAGANQTRLSVLQQQ
jgi:hypothetical protein